MLSKKAKYAIKALLALANHQGDEPVRISDLARAEQIPAKFLEFILLGLKNQGILQSRKGKGGDTYPPGTVRATGNQQGPARVRVTHERAGVRPALLDARRVRGHSRGFSVSP